MAGVYSTLFIEAIAIEAFAEYVVPDGYLAVVRDVSALNLGAADDTAFNVENHSTSAIICYHGFVDEFEWFHADVRQVVEAGSTISMQVSGPTETSVRVCGYLLTLP